MAHKKLSGYVRTTWALRTYDVWGNARDGFEVNDVYNHGTVELAISRTKFNVGTPQEFIAAKPSVRQLRQVFGVPYSQIEVDGDDLRITVNRTRDGYPIGEMECTSHESLSPVRRKAR